MDALQNEELLARERTLVVDGFVVPYGRVKDEPFFGWHLPGGQVTCVKENAILMARKTLLNAHKVRVVRN